MVQKWMTSRRLKELQGFVGRVGYYHQHIFELWYYSTDSAG